MNILLIFIHLVVTEKRKEMDKSPYWKLQEQLIRVYNNDHIKMGLNSLRILFQDSSSL